MTDYLNGWWRKSKKPIHHFIILHSGENFVKTVCGHIFDLDHIQLVHSGNGTKFDKCVRCVRGIWTREIRERYEAQRVLDLQHHQQEKERRALEKANRPKRRRGRKPKAVQTATTQG